MEHFAAPGRELKYWVVPAESKSWSSWIEGMDLTSEWALAESGAPNVHQQMCTTRRPFQRLGGLLSNHPNQNQKKTTNYQMRKCTAEKFLQLFRAL